MIQETERKALPRPAAGLFRIMLVALLFLPVFAFEAPAFRPIGFCCTGFGVPGTGQPVIIGTTVIITSGEGFATVCDVSDPAAPRVARYVPSWYFTNQIYPVPSRNLAYLSNSRGPLLVLDGLKNISSRGEIKECEWNAAWGRAFLSGIAPDGIGYTVVANSIIVIDFKDPFHVKEKARVLQPRLKTADAGVPAQCLVFSKDFHVSAALLDKGARIGLYRWKSRTEQVLVSEINNKDLDTGKGAFTHGRINALDSKWLVVGHTVVRAMAGECPELSFWDISDLSRPRMVCEKVFYGSGTVIRGMALAGSRCFVIDGRASPGQHTVLPFQRSRLYVLDLDSLQRDTVKSHPDSSTPVPKTIAVFEDTVPCEYSCMTLDGNLLYVNDYNYGLRIFDIHNPHAPVKLGGVPTAAEGRWLYVSGDYAYMAHTFGGTIHAIHVKNPAHPKTEGYFWDGHWLNYRSKIRGRENAMYLPEDDRVAVIDISDPVRPMLAGEACNWANQHIVSPCIDVADTLLFVTEGPHEESPGQLLLFTIAEPLKPVLICTFDLPEKKGYHLYAAGNAVYCVPYGGNHIVRVDVSNPGLPRITADLKTTELSIKGKTYPFTIRDGGGNGSPGMACSGGYLYMVTGGNAQDEPSMFIFDVRDSSVIRPAGVFFASDRSGWQYFSCDVLVNGSRLYLGDYGGESAYDITDPVKPKRLARYHRAYAWQLGMIRDNLLYVPKLDGLEILEVPH